MAGSVGEWTKVLINPLGLAGYVLFLLFGAMAHAKRKDERRWIVPTALIAAVVALLGGLSLAYRNVAQQTLRPSKAATARATPSESIPSRQENDHSQQISTGDKSANIQGVQGDVTLTYGAGSHAEPQKQKRTHNKTAETEPQ